MSAPGETLAHVPDLPRPVQVQHEDGRWYDGWLEAVRRDEDGWGGFVRFSTGPDERRLLWFGEDRIRAPLVRPEPPPTATADDTHDTETAGQSRFTPPDQQRDHP